jgi:hypothetical protein
VLNPKSTKGTIPCLLQRWQRDGLPTYAQFDNDNVFQGRNVSMTLRHRSALI